MFRNISGQLFLYVLRMFGDNLPVSFLSKFLKELLRMQYSLFLFPFIAFFFDDVRLFLRLQITYSLLIIYNQLYIYMCVYIYIYNEYMYLFLTLFALSCSQNIFRQQKRTQNTKQNAKNLKRKIPRKTHNLRISFPNTTSILLNLSCPIAISIPMTYK